MRRCLILRQGERAPLKPPAPFPSESMFQNGSNLSRVRKPRTNRAPLTDSFRSEEAAGMRERGPLGGHHPGRSLPLVGPEPYPKTSCHADLRRGTTSSGPGRGPMAGFEVTLYGRF